MRGYRSHKKQNVFGKEDPLVKLDNRVDMCFIELYIHYLSTLYLNFGNDIAVDPKRSS